MEENSSSDDKLDGSWNKAYKKRNNFKFKLEGLPKIA